MKEKIGYVPSEVIGEADRDKQSNRVLQLLEKLKVKEIFKNHESKKEFIENLDFEGFKKLLVTFNGNLLNIPIPERSFSSSTVTLTLTKDAAKREKMAKGFAGASSDNELPRQEDKEELLHELFNCVQKMARNNMSMKDIAIEMGVGINAIHAFEDGNGRTSRLFNFILAEDYQGSEEQNKFLQKLLGDKGRLQLNLNPQLGQSTINAYIQEKKFGLNGKNPIFLKDFKLLAINGSLNLNKDFKNDFTKYIFSDNFFGDAMGLGSLAVYQFLEDKRILKQCLSEDGLGVILVKKLGRYLNQENMEEILSNYWNLKKESVSILLKSLVSPDDYKATNRLGSISTIKEDFLKELDESEYQSYQEINGQALGLIWQELKRAPFAKEIVSQDELLVMREVRKNALEIIKKDSLERAAVNFDYQKEENRLKQIEKARGKHLDEGDKQGHIELRNFIFNKKRELYASLLEISEKNLNAFITYLEKFPIWANRFVTRNNSQGISDDRQALTDSEYFVTKSGCSLRLAKYYLAEKGLTEVVQPFMEKIIYLDEDGQNFDNPQVDLNPVEYVTDEFREALVSQENKDYESRIKKYNIDGEIYYLNPNDGDIHKAYPIVKIIK
jgi:hypothetical protein